MQFYTMLLYIYNMNTIYIYKYVCIIHFYMSYSVLFLFFLLATTHYQKVRYIGGAADINNGYIMGVCVYVYIYMHIYM